MRGFIVLGVLVALVGEATAQVELKNDGFDPGEQVGFQAGFVTGEIGASRFVAPEAGRQLLSVQMLFGGQAGTRTVTLKVWDDTAGTNAPGAELHSEEFDVTASDSAMQELTLSGNVVVTQQFRVGIQFQHSGLPSIARDDDGTIAADRNYIYAPPTWHRSSEFLLTGDWVIRAFVSGSGGGGTPDANPGGGPDGGGGGGESCNGNPDCPVGQYCGTAMTCTFDCRSSDDCGGDTCNSLGQCVEGEGGGGGCCRASGGAQGGILLALGVLVLVVRRRRR